MVLLPFSSFLFLLLSSLASSLNSDGLSLLALKSAISFDPTSALSTWRESDLTPCNWPGISCLSSHVISISLPDKSLSGYIPSEIGYLSSLRHLSLPHNNLSNTIPLSLFNASSLVYLDLSQNALVGPIPPQIKALKFLTHLDLSSNFLNGSLPVDIADLPNISGTFNLSYNLFTGRVPESFGKLPVSVSLDLQHNNLSGEIPQIGSLVNQGPTAFAGNPNLCGFPLRNQCPNTEIPKSPEFPRNPKPSLSVLPSPPPPSTPTGKVSGRGISVPILSGVLFIVGVVTVSAWLLRRKWGSGERKRGKGESGESKEEGQKGDFFLVDDDEVLGLELEELLRASAYVVGKSRNGIVYKVVLGRGVSVAVRRLSEGFWRFKEFESEVEAIARVRHPNIVRLRAYYYATDEKLLVSDFISNGSLHAALHGRPLSSSSAPLSWAARLKIAQGAARGLAHIHECSPRKYVHGNIKSSKILLDDDFQAYIADFGLNRLMPGTFRSSDSMSKKQTSTQLAVSGFGSKIPTSPSACYLAPEARISGSRLTQKCDVYSFGIVLLEILTGRSPDAKSEPTDDGLESFVRKAFQEERPLSEIVDGSLLHEVYAKKQVLAAFHIALGCTDMDPEMRPRMRSASESLDRIGYIKNGPTKKSSHGQPCEPVRRRKLLFAGNHANLCGFPLRNQCPNTEIPKSPEFPRNPKPSLSVLPSPPPPSTPTGKVSGRGISVPILSGVLFIVGVVTVSAWLLRRKWGSGEGKRGKGESGESKEEGQKRDFFLVDDDEVLGLELEELLRASAYVVGKSRNGIVYKVVLGRGVLVAVRRLSEGFWRFNEFESEVEAIARVRHPNIVRLRAYYYATDEKLLVSDFISNGSLHAALHGGPLSSSSAPLSWAARLKIAQGAARGLPHIHECSPRKYVHGNIKSSKILLDDDFQAYIADFGLNRLMPGTYRSSDSMSKTSKKQTSTQLAVSGFASKIPTSPSVRYLAPEARISGSRLTQKCDVYSFGILLLEILTGRSPDTKTEPTDDGLESFVRKAFQEERPLSEIVDGSLLHEVYEKKQVLAAFHIALGCTQMRPRMRSASESLDRIGCH